MGKRSTSRRIALQALYACDLNQETPQQNLADVLSTDKFIKETEDFAKELLFGTLENIKEIDKIISQYSKGWDLSRTSIVDRNILRLAIYEINYHKQAPSAVVIDEAVELAKKFGGEDSYRFINGILGNLV